MEALEPLTPQQQAAAAARECERLCRTNGNPLTKRAFATQLADANAHTWSRRGIDRVFGVEDRKFLSKQSVDSRLPVAQASGRALFLQRAIEIGDLNLVCEQLATLCGDTVVNMRNCHGETLLHTAVLHDQLPIAQTLLLHGASPIVELPCHEVSESTLESVVPRNENFRYSRVLRAAEATPVHYACAVGNLDMLKLLLSPRASAVPFKLRRPGSLLVWAITCGHVHIVEHLVLKKRIEADCFDEDGNNAVGIAALVLGDNTSSAATASSASVSARATGAESLAVLKQILKLLLRRDGIDVNHKNMYGLTPFDVAESAAVKQLLAQLGGKTARVLDMEKLLRWDREAFRAEVTYSRDRLRRTIVPRDVSTAASAAGTPSQSA